MPLRIAFFKSNPSAYLPEIQAYASFFAGLGIECKIFYQYEPNIIKNFDIEWHLMGLDYLPHNKGRMKIHEYASLSSPPFGKWKDLIKKKVNIKPDLRIFLSPIVKKLSNFGEDVPYCFRDMGIAPAFFKARPEIKKVFDLVYCGNLERERQPRKYIRSLYQKWTDCRLLLVGSIPKQLRSWLCQYPNVSIKGRVTYEQIPAVICQAKYGLDFRPTVHPLNVQTSTKLLEYCAAGLPVATTDNPWLQSFEQETGARLFRLTPNLDNLSPEALRSFNYKLPSLQNRMWDKIITQSGILHHIENHFGIQLPRLPSTSPA